MGVKRNNPIFRPRYRDDFKTVVLLRPNQLDFVSILKWAKPDPAFGRLPVDYHFYIVGLFA